MTKTWKNKTETGVDDPADIDAAVKFHGIARDLVKHAQNQCLEQGRKKPVRDRNTVTVGPETNYLRMFMRVLGYANKIQLFNSSLFIWCDSL
jgi:hypothetical protein